MTVTSAVTRVMIVDDHPVVRKGLASFLGHEPDIEVVGMADSGEQALEMAQDLHPDIVLMDLSMPGMGGIEATRRLVETAPETRVMMLTSFGGHERMVEALKSGAVGSPQRPAQRRIHRQGADYCFLTSATSAATDVRASPNSIKVFGS
jgi:DNA-binding NarL/FixJ family response regulator